jgi:hypothetical protein
MGVTAVREKWQGRGATTDEKGVRTLTRQWDVDTNDDTTGEPEVIDAVIAKDPTAKLYAPHPKWAWAVCRGLECSPNGGPRVWTVKANYSSAPFEAKSDGSGEAGNTDSPSPLQSNETRADLRPPKISISRKEVTKVLEKDAVTGARVVNNLGPGVMGDPFDPPPEVFRSHHIITWKFFRPIAQLNWFARASFMDSINAGIFTVFGVNYPIHGLRCIDYSVDTVWETGDAGLQLFFELTVQAEFNPDLWDVKILNTGRRMRKGGSIGDPTNPARADIIVDANGQPVADPVPLDNTGQPVALGGAFHYAEPAGYVPKDWSTLLA